MKMIMNEQFLRQSGIIPVTSTGRQILVIGCGAVGSATAMILAKCGYGNLILSDFDKVEVHNISNQVFDYSMISEFKSVALATMIKRSISGIFPMTYHGVGDDEKIIPLLTSDAIVISAVDSMTARTKMFNLAVNSSARFFIDPRMSAEKMLIYVVDLKNETSIATYRASLYSDEEALKENCTEKATMYCASILGGLVAKSVKDITVNNTFQKSTEFNLNTYYYKSWGQNGN